METRIQKKRTRMILKNGNAYLTVHVSTIVCFYYDLDLVWALLETGHKYIVNESLSELENVIDPELFFRVNRKCIININFVRSYKTEEPHKILISMEAPAVKFMVGISQKRIADFRKWINAL